MKTIIKIFYFVVVILLLPFNVQSQGIEISSDGIITNTGTSTIEINNGSLINNGTYTKGSETLIFSGTNTASISGSSLLEVYNLTLSGNIVNVNPGFKLTVSNSLTNNGTLNLLSDATSGTATILTPGTISENGTYSVQQYLTTGRNWYISSPVSAAKSSVFNAASDVTNKLYWYDETQGSSLTDNWPQIKGNTTSLGVMKGYVANLPTDGIVTFTGGTLNNSASTPINLTFTLGQTNAGFNLVGNPYPSYLNAMAAINANSALEKSIWYRTKASSTYYFETINTTSGLSTNNAGVYLTGYVPPMQAFWVKTSSATTLVFNNNERSHSKTAGETGTVATTLLKSPVANKVVQQLLRLLVSNGINSDEAVIYFNPNASNGFDPYDSQKRSNANAAIPEIYTTVGNLNMVFNGMNSITLDSDLVLGFTTGQSNSFTIKASEMSNFDASIKVILKDKLLNVEKNLTDGLAYSFTSDAITTNNRFSIVFKSASISTGNIGVNEVSPVTVFRNVNNQITILRSNVVNEGTVTVCNTTGQSLASCSTTGTTTVLNRSFVPGVYFVTVNADGNKITKKIIVN